MEMTLPAAYFSEQKPTQEKEKEEGKRKKRVVEKVRQYFRLLYWHTEA